MKIPAPKPSNFDDLTRTWNNPQAFALERARYFEELRRRSELPVDITQPRRSSRPPS